MVPFLRILCVSLRIQKLRLICQRTNFSTFRCQYSGAVSPLSLVVRSRQNGQPESLCFSTIGAMPPSLEKDKKAVKLKPRRRGEPDTPGTAPKKYELPFDVILEIRKAASIYGSQGRAVQVGSELLVRLPKPISVPQPRPESIKRRTYKLSPRTIEVIQQLSESEYDSPGQVLAACMKILKVKRLNSKYLADSD